MSVLVEMKVAGWSWALLPKAPHSFWSYQQKSLLFQQWFPWQCSQSRKEGRKKKSQWHFKCKLYWKKMFSSEENTRSLSIAGATAAECRTRVPHRGRGHYQITTCSGILSHWEELWSLKQAPKSRRNHRADTCTLDRSSGGSQHCTASPRAVGRTKAYGYPSPTSLSIFHLILRDLDPLNPTGDAHSRGYY